MSVVVAHHMLQNSLADEAIPVGYSLPWRKNSATVGKALIRKKIDLNLVSTSTVKEFCIVERTVYETPISGKLVVL